MGRLGQVDLPTLPCPNVDQVVDTTQHLSLGTTHLSEETGTSATTKNEEIRLPTVGEKVVNAEARSTLCDGEEPAYER